MDLSYKNIWLVTYPIFISMLLQQIVGITDVIFLGHFSEIALSGSALGSTYFLTFFMLAVGFAYGSQILMACHNGEQNYQKIGPIFYQSCFILAVFALLLTLLSFYLTPLFLHSFVSSVEVYTATLDYINYRFIGCLPLFVTIIIRSFYIAITKTKILGITSCCTILLNIFFNYCLIFGNLGFSQMGIKGAALASVIAETCGLVIYIAYSLKKLNFITYGLKKLVYWQTGIVRDIFGLSVWTMLQEFISISTWFIFFLAIEHSGADYLASSNIIRSISAFPFVIIISLAITAGTFTSNLIGAGEENKVMFCCLRIIKIAFIFTLPILILFYIFNNNIIVLYTDNKVIQEESLSAYPVMLGAFLPAVPGFIFFNALSATGQTKKAMYFEIIASCAYLVHIYTVIICLKASFAWCWTVDYTYNIIIMLLSAYYIFKRKFYCKNI